MFSSRNVVFRNMKKSPQIHLLVFVALALARSATAATITLDCTAGCIGKPFGGALFSTGSVQPSGSGVFKPFVRIHQSPKRTGTTRAARSATTRLPVSTPTPSRCPTSITWSASSAPTSTSSCSTSENRGTPTKPCCRSTRWSSAPGPRGSLTQADACPTTPTYSLDTGTDRAVLLNYDLFKGGNGNSDLFVYIPTTALGPTPLAYFYMYTAFGHQPGFESEGHVPRSGRFQHYSIARRASTARRRRMTLQPRSRPRWFSLGPASWGWLAHTGVAGTARTDIGPGQGESHKGEREQRSPFFFLTTRRSSSPFG